MKIMALIQKVYEEKKESKEVKNTEDKRQETEPQIEEADFASTKRVLDQAFSDADEYSEYDIIVQ